MHGTETMPVGRVRDGALDLLKWLALLSMVLDHLRYVGLSLDGLYVPGRLAFPWFCLAIAANLHRVRNAPVTGQWRYLGWLLLFSVISEVPYRLFIDDADTLNVLPTLALGLLIARGWQQKALFDRGLAVIALALGAVFSAQLMFGFFGVLLPLALLLVFSRPWYFSVLPGLVCVAANQWQILLSSGTPVALMGLAACLIAPLAGLVLLRQAKNTRPPAMRRWAYALYPLHFLLLLLVRQVIA
ncbi:conjugal transfer protein TraX [Pseudomonas syringae]|uniref:Conjugal transfer protein TraX n=1 Tax=Pseudomonas syringae TaxID=317 RepID=A0A9Q3X9N3_PSESX|nr:conjugal transfer protein TraX [Pseudomonas syringae]MCF5065147.1 conjugal transfer protein TraX [Pseudomonas syringae]MCF5075204.1 conjugal transfer protein TraX [Pseudomonas syringae]MCF5117865.1 conjugal transfer protein TraX [Pseudomonas syringae]MCF5378016.1 conjugal transfer protein TraX [Pseudomonas syringae]